MVRVGRRCRSLHIGSQNVCERGSSTRPDMVGLAAAESLVNLVIRAPARRHVGMTAACSSDPWSACSCGPLDAEQRIAHHVAVACEHMTDRIVVWRASRAPGTGPAVVTAGPYPVPAESASEPVSRVPPAPPGRRAHRRRAPPGSRRCRGGRRRRTRVPRPAPARRPGAGPAGTAARGDLVPDQQVPVAGRPSPQLGEVLTDGDLVPGARPATAGQARRLHEVPARGRVGRCGVADHGGVLDRTGRTPPGAAAVDGQQLLGVRRLRGREPPRGQGVRGG